MKENLGLDFSQFRVEGNDEFYDYSRYIIVSNMNKEKMFLLAPKNNGYTKGFERNAIQNIIENLGSISHEYIQNFRGFARDGELFVLIEAYEYSVYDLLYDNNYNHKPLPFDVAVEVIWRLAKAIEYLHTNGICHYDIRPENMVFTLDSNDIQCCKLGNFDRSLRSIENDIVFSLYGTPNYQSPERFERAFCDPKKADIWAFGVFIVTILTAKLPFTSKGSSLTYEEQYNIIKDQVLHQNIIEPFFSTELKNFLGMIFRPDPNSRATISDIIAHPFMEQIKKKVELLNKTSSSPLMCYINERRAAGFEKKDIIKADIYQIITSRKPKDIFNILMPYFKEGISVVKSEGENNFVFNFKNGAVYSFKVFPHDGAEGTFTVYINVRKRAKNDDFDLHLTKLTKILQIPI